MKPMKCLTASQQQPAERSGPAQEIAKVLDDSREKLADVNGSLEREKAEYDTVCLHIERANDLGTQKSTMFENMENLLVQFVPIVKELERKN